MPNVLRNFDLVPEEEALKFWRDIFDILFLTMVNNFPIPNLDGLAFKCILRMLSIMSSPKGKLFLPFLDNYINNQFSAINIQR
jgi:hypothetical protein